MQRESRQSIKGFTLLELVIVIGILSVLFSFVAIRLGVVSYWKQESSLRRFTQLLTFLHSQAVMDQSYYRLEFDFQTNSYKIGVFQPTSTLVAGTAGGGGYLTDELALFLSPSIGGDQNMIPPPSYPSLAEPQVLPYSMTFEDVVTPRGKMRPGDEKEQGNPYLLFSPKGFSEFGVVHFRLEGNQSLTVLVNPWTGIADVYREYKEFQWTLGNKRR